MVFGKMALKVDEQWVRERVHLKHDNLDDVKSLSLPGSYHEKISHLGTSLHGFARLKHLDLSRNTIGNLEGIGHLQMLETLNLYYNSISTLNDLYKLRTLINLKELDIRLNPVTKIEPDHRLFLVHMLPNLKKLDDRSVRDSERKAALMHFSTDQASEFSDDRLQDQNHKSNKLTVPRAELVRSLGQREALDNDDVLLLDVMAQKDGNLSRPNYFTGSSNKFPDVQDYRQQELQKMHAADKEEIGHPDSYINQLTRPSKDHLHIQFPHNTKPPIPNATSKSKAEVDSSYAPYTAQGNFTPTPKTSTFYQAVEQDRDGHQGSKKPDNFIDSSDFKETSSGSMNSKDLAMDRDLLPAFSSEEEQLQKHESENWSTTHGYSERKSTLYGEEKPDGSPESFFLHKLVDLVDKYWNGTKSLHNHSKFKGIATDILKSYQATYDQGEQDRTVKQLRQQLSVKEEGLGRLSEQYAQLQEECTTIQNELEKEKAKQKQYKETASEELTTLHTRFKTVQEENKSLKAALESQKGSVLERKKQTDEVLKGRQVLQQENQALRQKLEQQSANLQQLHELTNMLQESHRSLVATNDHLLLELAQEKERHQSEVNQLHWSYKQLKKSIEWIPNPDKGNLKT